MLLEIQNRIKDFLNEQNDLVTTVQVLDQDVHNPDCKINILIIHCKNGEKFSINFIKNEKVLI